MTCAGFHRSLGVEISFVRSIVHDQWKEKDLKSMEMGGNSAARLFFNRAGIQRGTGQGAIRAKYESAAAEQYRTQLLENVQPDETASAFSELSIANPPPAKVKAKPAPESTPAPTEESNLRAKPASRAPPSSKSGLGVKRTTTRTTTAPKSKGLSGGQKSKVEKSTFDDFDSWDDFSADSSSAPSSSSSFGGVGGGGESKSSAVTPEQTKPNLHSHSIGSTSSKFSFDEGGSSSQGNGVSGSSKQPSSSANAPQFATRNPQPRKANEPAPSINKYSNAKAISSDQYFGRDQKQVDPEVQRRLAMKQGSSSISSADIFDEEEEFFDGFLFISIIFFFFLLLN